MIQSRASDNPIIQGSSILASYYGGILLACLSDAGLSEIFAGVFTPLALNSWEQRVPLRFKVARNPYVQSEPCECSHTDNPDIDDSII